MRLIFYVEGQTEFGFVTEVLSPHFYKLGAHDVRPCLVWSAADRFRITKGGGRKWSSAIRGLQSLLGDSKKDVRFTTMFDLYALFNDFPGMEEALAQDDRSESVAILERKLSDEMQDRRLIPYIQLHEFEALLLSDCNELAQYHGEQGSVAEAAVKASGGPEKVNDQRETAPSKRILEWFPSHSKRLDGPGIAARIGLDTIRDRCPHFNQWIQKLEGALRLD